MPYKDRRVFLNIVQKHWKKVKEITWDIIPNDVIAAIFCEIANELSNQLKHFGNSHCVQYDGDRLRFTLEKICSRI